MQRIDFIQALHGKTQRNYVERVTAHDKAHCATVARRFGADYWDGERCYGYGGYRYDGRWRPIAEAMAAHYGLHAGMRLLDVGCGKAYLLYEFCQILPGIEVYGLDISHYGLMQAHPPARARLVEGQASALPFADGSFDFVVSLGTLHNLAIAGLWAAIGEIERVSRGNRKYIMVESFRTEAEKANLLYWQLTCQSFHSPESWQWLYEQAGYHGDYGFIYFN